MILFLDYDGVLHPDPCFDEARLFEHAPRLAEALADFPEVVVVLSTSWRTQRTLDELTAPLPAELRARVVDVTPPYSFGDTPVSLVPYRRHAECMQWLQANGQEQTPWFALDDRSSLYMPYCEQLIHCNSVRGFSEETVTRLRAALTRARRRMAETVDALI